MRDDIKRPKSQLLMCGWVGLWVGLMALILSPIIPKETHKESIENFSLWKQVCVRFKVNLFGVDMKRKHSAPTTHINSTYTHVYEYLMYITM